MKEKALFQLYSINHLRIKAFFQVATFWSEMIILKSSIDNFLVGIFDPLVNHNTDSTWPKFGLPCYSTMWLFLSDVSVNRNFDPIIKINRIC